MFGFWREKKKVIKLNAFLRERIDDAERDFDKTRSGWITFKRSKAKDTLAINPLIINGFNHALRAIFVAGAPPASVIHMTAANVAIDTMMGYYKKTPKTLASTETIGASSLSFNIVNNEKVSVKFKEEVAKMRHTLQAVIFATAEYVEMEQLVSLEDALRANVDPNKMKQIRKFVDAQYRFHVSYRSMAIALQLFASVNQEMLRKIKSVSHTDSEKFWILSVTNAVFVYEIADLIISFIRAFSLQGVQELRQIHEEVLAEVELGRAENERTLARVRLRQDTGRTSMLNLDVETASAKARLGALTELQDVWFGMMQKVDEAESGVYTFKECIEDLEIIKEGAAGNLRILDLASVTKMVQTNVDAMEGMLQIERLQLPPITADDVLRFLGVDRRPGIKPNKLMKTDRS